MSLYAVVMVDKDDNPKVEVYPDLYGAVKCADDFVREYDRGYTKFGPHGDLLLGYGIPNDPEAVYVYKVELKANCKENSDA